MEYDLNTYERMQEANPRKSYEFLVESAESAIRLQDKRRNMLEREQLLKIKKPKGAVNATPATEQHNAKDEKDKQNGAANSDRNKSRAKGEDVNASSKGKSKGDGKDGEKLASRPCIFFHFTKCTRDDCPFSHAPLSEDAKKELAKGKGKGKDAAPKSEDKNKGPQERGRSRERSASPRGKDKQRPKHCFTFLKLGSCPVTDCPGQHMNK